MTDKDISAYPEEAQNYIKELREESKTNRLKVAERDTAVAQSLQKITELETAAAQSVATSTAYTTLKDQHAQVLVESAKTKLESVRLKLAVENGLPLELADRLTGDTEEALKADAEVLKKFVKATGGRVALDRTTVADKPATERDALRDAIRNKMENN
jgi:hypothetical protein